MTVLDLTVHLRSMLMPTSETPKLQSFLPGRETKEACLKFNLPHPWASEKQFWFTVAAAAPREGDEVLPGHRGERYKLTSSFYLWWWSFFLSCLLYQTQQMETLTNMEMQLAYKRRPLFKLTFFKSGFLYQWPSFLLWTIGILGCGCISLEWPIWKNVPKDQFWRWAKLGNNFSILTLHYISLKKIF